MKIHKEIDQLAKIDSSVRINGTGRIKIGAYCTVEPNVFIDLGNGGTIILGERSKLKYGAVLRAYGGSIHIGSRSSIGEYTVCAGHGGLDIRSNVIIAGHCYITASDHIYSAEFPTRFQGETAKGIIIHENSWIGANVTVLDGVVVGSSSVVGANALVNKRIEDCSINVGVPAKPKSIIKE